MRDYGKVFSSFWTSADIRRLSDDGKFLATYLLTCPHGNVLGCFRLSNGYIVDDLGWEVERVTRSFEELHRNGFAYRCPTTYWVVIHKHFKWNKLDNENVGKKAGKVLDAITPPDDIRAMLCKSIIDFGHNFQAAKMAEIVEFYERHKDRVDTVLNGSANGIDTVSETVSKPIAITIPISIPIAIKETSTPENQTPAEKPLPPDGGAEEPDPENHGAMDDKAILFETGIAALVKLGMTKKAAGGMIGKCLKDVGGDTSIALRIAGRLAAIEKCTNPAALVMTLVKEEMDPVFVELRERYGECRTLPNGKYAVGERIFNREGRQEAAL